MTVLQYSFRKIKFLLNMTAMDSYRFPRDDSLFTVDADDINLVSSDFTSDNYNQQPSISSDSINPVIANQVYSNSNPIRTGSCSGTNNNVTNIAMDTTRSPGDGFLQNLEDEEAHCHKAIPQKSKKARNQLIVVCCLCSVFMIAEIAGGVISGSLALLTDATHLASDITGFLVSLFAIWISSKPPTIRMSYGYYRAEILGALTSILIIWIVTAILCYLATERLISGDYEIKANEMLITATLGVVFNIIMGVVLHVGLCSCEVSHGHLGGAGHGHSHGNGGHNHSHGGDNHNIREHSTEHIQSLNGNNYTQNGNQIPSFSFEQQQHQQHNNDVNAKTIEKKVDAKNINVRAAFIHVVGDFIQSIGVLIAAIIIKIQPEYKIADPICTFLFSLLVLITTITVLRDIILVLMEGVPRDVNYRAIKKDLLSIDGVQGAHSLHVWALSMDKIASSVHLAIDKNADWNRITKRANSLLKDRHGAFQSTVQVDEYQEQIMKNCIQCIKP